MKLDAIDLDILRELQKDAKISNKELAKLCGISPSTCIDRVRRLRKEKALLGFHATVDPKVLGINVQAMISLKLNNHSDVTMETLVKDLRQRQEVIEVYVLAGASDMLVHAVARDVDHLRSIVRDACSARSDVSMTETSLIFDYYRSTELPNYLIPPEEEAKNRHGEHI